MKDGTDVSQILKLFKTLGEIILQLKGVKI
jgi:hypothetical protein